MPICGGGEREPDLRGRCPEKGEILQSDMSTSTIEKLKNRFFGVMFLEIIFISLKHVLNFIHLYITRAFVKFWTHLQVRS